MRGFFLIACVGLCSSLSRASELDLRRIRPRAHAPTLRLIDLPREPREACWTRALEAPSPIAPDAQLRYDDMTHRAENTVISALESAQHLGNHYRTWLWLTPLFGSVNGAALRIDIR